MQQRKKNRPSKKQQPSGIKGALRELVSVIVIVLFVNSFVVASFQVPTGSMEDTVKIGDLLFVNKFIYGGSTPYSIPLTSIRIPHFRVPGFRKVARGDVIVFDWPGNRDQVEKPAQTWYLKRCIALPGDTIRIENRAVYVDGKSFENPPHSKFLRSSIYPPGYANPYIFPLGYAFNEDNYGPLVVPSKGMTLRLDARSFPGWEVFIKREGHAAVMDGGKIYIDGKDTSSYTVGCDYIFAMGDNRDNSMDSRFWGFVPLEDVIGTPLVVYWSWDPQIPLYDLFEKLSSVDLRRVGTLVR